tara:strand:- start:498 stop:1343 length:846 start_codon:yes stop_codon:yes gene_type:complete
MKRAIVVQPGKSGDLILTTPIAKFFNDRGYEIDWPVWDGFISYFEAFDYINPISCNMEFEKTYHSPTERYTFGSGYVLFIFDKIKQLIDEGDYDLVINPCFSFGRSAIISLENEKMVEKYKDEGRNWIDQKYVLAKVPLEKRWDYKWTHNEQKEDELLKLIKNLAKKKYGSEKYSLIHNYQKNFRTESINGLENPVYFSYIEGYEVYDWYKVILEAEKIVCCDSCLVHFVEVVPEFKNKEKYYVGTEEPHRNEYMRNILVNNWINLTPVDISYAGFYPWKK